MNILRTLRLLLFRPDSSSENTIFQAFSKHPYDINVVEGIAALQSLNNEAGLSFDCAAVPLGLSDGASGVSAVIQLRANEKFSRLPIAGFVTGSDRAVVPTLYGAGADTIFCQPFDVDLIYHQLVAMVRDQESLQHRVERSDCLTEAAKVGFDSLPDGIIVSDLRFRVLFINKSARSMFGIAPDLDVIPAVLSTQLAEAAREAFTKDGKREGTLLNERNFNDSNNRTFSTLLHIETTPSGFWFHLPAVEKTELFSNRVAHLERSRAVNLLLAPACLLLLSSNHLGTPTEPLATVQRAFQYEGEFSDLGSILTSLIEYLDLFINSMTILRVDLKENFKVRIRPSRLFQLLGYLIFYASDVAGTRSETIISAERNSTGKALTITVSSSPRAITENSLQDALVNAVHGRLAYFGDESRGSMKLISSLKSAEDLIKGAGGSIVLLEERKEGANFAFTFSFEIGLFSGR